MAKHPNKVADMTAKELAEKFSNTTYKFQLDFFNELSNEYTKEVQKDCRKGNIKLAGLLAETVGKVFLVVQHLKKIWKICEPRMPERLQTCPECKGDKDYHFLGQPCCPKCFGKGKIKETE